jgi:hypothetical protein
MSSAPTRESPSPLKREYHPLPAFLSYLVPGLGQISQGRVGKGLLFFVCVLTLFYYGMVLGKWSNVYLPDSAGENNPWKLPRLLANLYNRPQFAAQFFVGIAAWPAVIQYATYDKNSEAGPFFGDYQRVPYESRSGDKGETKISGDVTDPQKRTEFREKAKLESNKALSDWRGKTINELQQEGDKSWDLGWVFTVIAGALNIMVIYDAFAGPAFVVNPPAEQES